MAESRPRRVAVITVGRSDFSILRPLCERLNAAAGFEFALWAGGAHFDPAGGMTIRDIEASGLPVAARIEAGEYHHDPAGTARAMAAQVRGFGDAMAAAIAAGRRPDLVLILGDRFEAIAAGLAMVPFGVPVGHISGGSITEGAIDDLFRHALTKLAALHFCDLPEFAQRLHRMGEDPARIFVTGALGLDGIHDRPAEPFTDFADHFGFDGLRPGYVLVTLHPETVAAGETAPMAQAMVAALEQSGRQVIYTYPNADPGADEIIAMIEDAAKRLPGHFVVRNFGARWFYSAMAHAGMVVGNSSSGIYEAASFGLPVVDIGERQKNRFHGPNVLHADRTRDGIAAAMQSAMKSAAGLEFSGMVNPYGDGHGAARVMQVLASLNWAAMAAPKGFADYDPDYSSEKVELL